MDVSPVYEITRRVRIEGAPLFLRSPVRSTLTRFPHRTPHRPPSTNNANLVSTLAVRCSVLSHVRAQSPRGTQARPYFYELRLHGEDDDHDEGDQQDAYRAVEPVVARLLDEPLHAAVVRLHLGLRRVDAAL